MQQEPLFQDIDSRPPMTFADERLDAKEKPRLNRQCIEILRFMCGKVPHWCKVSNTQLNAIAFRYSARIHDLRRAGINIVIVSRDKEAGVNWYDFDTEEDEERARLYL